MNKITLCLGMAAPAVLAISASPAVAQSVAVDRQQVTAATPVHTTGRAIDRQHDRVTDRRRVTDRPHDRVTDRRAQRPERERDKYAKAKKAVRKLHARAKNAVENGASPERVRHKVKRIKHKIRKRVASGD